MALMVTSVHISMYIHICILCIISPHVEGSVIITNSMNNERSDNDHDQNMIFTCKINEQYSLCCCQNWQYTGLCLPMRDLL